MVRAEWPYRRAPMIRSEIRGGVFGCSVGKVKQDERNTGNDEPDALHRRMYGDGEEDEIRSDDPSSDESPRISQDHARTDPKNGRIHDVGSQTGCRIGVMGNARLGDEERKLRLGLHSLCRRWFAVVGVPKIGTSRNRVVLDETRIEWCDCKVGESRSEIDCRYGRRHR